MLRVEQQINNTTVVVAEGETQLEVFKQLASMTEVFDNSVCQKCHNKEGHGVSFTIRKASKGKKEFEYPELVCKDGKCRAKLTFGQADGGVLFPVRFERGKSEDGTTVYLKDSEGKNIPRGKWGWVRYNKETGKEE